MSVASKLLAGIKNDHIQAATASGLCIIILALAFKKVLHVESTNLESSLPGFVFAIYESVKAKATRRIWTRPMLWNIAMLVTTGIIILRRAL
jgi:hypothetical protein